MFYVVAILIAGLWAAFLLPSFFDHRSRAPRTTTRDFARTKRLLQQVSSADPDGEDYVRHHAQIRRKRILIGLGLTALVVTSIRKQGFHVVDQLSIRHVRLAVAIRVDLYSRRRSVPRVVQKADEVVRAGVVALRRAVECERSERVGGIE